MSHFVLQTHKINRKTPGVQLISKFLIGATVLCQFDLIDTCLDFKISSSRTI